MGQETMAVHVPQLAQKLNRFFSSSTLYKDRAGLANYFGRARNTIDGWVTGNGSTYPPNSIPDELVDKLLALLGEFNVAAEQSRTAWLGTLEEFDQIIRSALFVRDRVDLLQTLRACPDSLKVTYTRNKPGTLGMLQNLIAVPADAIHLKPGWEISFNVATVAGHRFIALLHSQEGWRVVAPGGYHPGELDGDATRVPVKPGEYFGFKQPYSEYYRFAFIEHQAALQSVLPYAGDLEPLAPELVQALASQLREATWLGRWRYGEVNVIIR